MNIVRIVFVLLASAGLGGCGAETLVMLPMVGAAGSAATTADAAFARGTLRAAQIGRFEDITAACEVAAETLGFEPVLTREKEGRFTLKTRDETGAYITISVKRRTENLSIVSVDVGFFGSEPVARTTLGVIRSEMAQSVQKILPSFGGGPSVDFETGP